MATNILPPKQVTFASTSVSGSTLEISGPKVSNESPLISREGDEAPKAQDPQRYTLADLLLRLALLFLPMIIVSVVLMVFLLFPTRWMVVFPYYQSDELPVNFTMVSNDSYYTTVSEAKVSLVSSWAVQASLAVMPCFMVLFSYCVAREVALRRTAAETISNTPEIHDLLLGLLKGEGWKDTWTWFKLTYQGRRSATVDDKRALHLAAGGMIISLSFYVLIFGAENWLHISVSSPTLRQYYPIEAGNSTSWVSWVPWSSFVPFPELCIGTLSSDLIDPFAPSDLVPCSLDNNGELYDLTNPEVGYTMLDTGLSSITSSFNIQDWPSFLDFLNTYGTANQTWGGAANQIVMYHDPKTGRSHALLFYQLGAYQINYKEEGSPMFTNIGLDFVANTTSMSTECEPITQACQLSNVTDNSSHNLSIPYNCSSMFWGDLNIPPNDGLEQFRGWDTSFYAMSNGLPKNISVASQLNPFYFNATAAVSSTTFADLAANGGSGVWDGSIVNAGDHRVAFALSCNSTVYDVQYSMINGSIISFDATPSDPRKASIIKAPLQVGFGRHNLFNEANLAVLKSDQSVSEAMAIAFSQVGMALASGAFDNAIDIKQRIRYDQVVTQVPKAAFWFLVVLCFTYAALGLAIFMIAVWLRRKEKYARVQEELLPRVKLRPWKLAWGIVQQVFQFLKLGKDVGKIYERGGDEGLELYERDSRYI